jgi:tetratricopeptide (TPR) repeat protein
VDEATKKILQLVMDEAKNYNNFAELLCNKTISEDVPELLIYYAYYHAYNQLRFDLVRKLVDTDRKSDLAKPLVLLTSPWGNIDWEEFQRSISSALKVAPNDWIACELYMLWRVDIGTIASYTEIQTDLETLKILESKIESDEEFSCFLPNLNYIKARVFMQEGNVQEAKAWFNRAIYLAKKHERLIVLASLLLDKANMIKNVNFNEALSILKSQRIICEKLGLIYHLTINEATLGLIAQARGQYETAIEHLESCVMNLDSIGQKSFLDFYKLVVAAQYNQMQDGVRALEIVNEVLKEYKSQPPWFPYIQQTNALLILDRAIEAAKSLDLARDWAPKSGRDAAIGSVHFLDGLMHKVRGEFSSAKFELEQAHSCFGSFPRTNQTLIHLTDVEIELFSYEKEKVKTDISGPWMKALAQQVEEKDIPGIAAQTLLLKAKFRFKQGRTDEAKKLVKKALKTSEKSGMTYLRSMAESLIPELLVS